MTIMSEFIKPAHKSVARSIGYALTTGDSDGWGMFTAVTLLRLDDVERVGVAYAALRSLNPDHVEDTLEAALGRSGVGVPQADRKSTRLNSSHASKSRMPSSA